MSYIKKNANRKPPEGASMSRYVKRSLTKQYKYLPVILERSEESGQRIRVLNTLFAIILCRILRDHSSRCGSVLLIRILPPLKNDGRGELRSGMVLTDFYLREEEYKMQAVPGHGEGGGVSRRKGQV